MSKKPDMPFATRGGCYVHVGDALVPQAIQPDGRVVIAGKFTAVEVPADGSVSASITGDGTGDALPEIENADDACGACADACAQLPEGCRLQSESPPESARKTTRRRK